MPISTRSVLPKTLPQRIKEAAALHLGKPVCVEASLSGRELQSAGGSTLVCLACRVGNECWIAGASLWHPDDNKIMEQACRIRHTGCYGNIPGRFTSSGLLRPPDCQPMTDIMSPEKRRQLMSRIRATNTTPERYVNALLEASDVDYDRHARDLPGRPDFVFRPQQLALFVDGDFWHGWRLPVWRHRLSDKWRSKIEKNRQRDHRNHRQLRRMGWTVLRIWEHQIETDVVRCVVKVLETLGKPHINRNELAAVYTSLPPLKRRNRLPRP